MVMRNRNDGADGHRWWDDLPPQLRARVSRPLPPQEPDAADEPRALFTPGELARDLSRLAILLCVIAVAQMLFLLVAISFIQGH